MFGRYFVLSHSITTFLRTGDVSLIDPRNLEVAAIGELKTKKIDESEAMTTIFLPSEGQLSAEMLPQVSDRRPATSNPNQRLEAKFIERAKRQMQRIEKVLEKSGRHPTPEHLAMTLACSKLDELFENSSAQTWGQVRIGSGLMLVGVMSRDSSLASQVSDPSESRGEGYNENLERIRGAAHRIVDKGLPDNSIIIDAMPYSATERYELQCRMRPFFWWPLSEKVREMVIFKQMAVLTLYNPAFLVKALREIGLDVALNKNARIEISKKYGDGSFKIIGVSYLYKLIQSQMLSEETIVALVQRSVERIERTQIEQTTLVDLDFDFVFR